MNWTQPKLSLIQQTWQRTGIRTFLKSKWLKPEVWIVLALIFAALRIAGLVGYASRNLFVWDQWDFFTPLFFPPAESGSAAFWNQFQWQHGPHRMGIGLPIMTYFLELTHWDARVIPWLSWLTLFATSVLALELTYRIRGRWIHADALIPLLILNVSQWEIFLNTPNLSHGPMPLFFLFVFIRAILMQDTWKKIALQIFALFQALFSGFGLFLVPVAVVYWAWSLVIGQGGQGGQGQGKRWHAGIGIGIASAFGSVAIFSQGYQFIPAIECFRFPIENPSHYAGYLALLFSRSMGGSSVASPALLLGVGVGLASLAVGLVCLCGGAKMAQNFLKKGAPSLQETSIATQLPAWSVIYFGVGFSLTFAFQAAIGRACQGYEAGLTSRYVPYLVPAIWAVYLYCTALLPRPIFQRWAGVGVAIAMSWLLLDGIPSPLDREKMGFYKSGKHHWIECYLRTESTEECNRITDFAAYPEPLSLEWKKRLDRMKFLKKGFFYDAAGE